ncbi:AAA family ATPase [Bacillus cereus group sp. BfR-BA-01451]|uniref:AAA family ATPase n=1 Tax=Bacillus cereus group TaxID=86661 RepID=UPI001F5708C4|nr:AAA family ATPase [Bacillus cereus group sp. BfR-BA-01451]
MFIEAVKIKIIGESGKEYGRYINFRENDVVQEISMIYGKNTLGKSTLINSIVYALKGEDIYNKNKYPINYNIILEQFLGDKVKSAEVYLQLFNQEQRVVVLRDAVNNEEAAIVFYNVSLNEGDNGKTLSEKTSLKEYYKMKKDRNLIGNETYQEFLFSFFKIAPIRKITEEQVEEGLIFYIQNLLPLFVIVQEAWTDIQANNPRYSIKAVKETAFEVIMKLSSSHVAKYDYLLEQYQSQLRQKTNSIKDLKEVIRILRHDNTEEIEKEIIENNKTIQDMQEKLIRLEGGRQVVDNILSTIRAKFKHLSLVVRRYEQSLSVLNREISEYEYYINKIQYDMEKNDKLKTAKRLIGILPIEKCPRCLNKLTLDEEKEVSKNHHCGLCGSELQSIDDTKLTLDYLKDELSDFNRLLVLKQEAKEETEGKLMASRFELKEIQNQMNEYEDSLKPKNLEQYAYYSREIGRISNSAKELEKDKEILSKYERLEMEKKEVQKQIDNLKEKKKDALQKEEQDKEKLRFFEKEFKKLLKKLDFLRQGFEEKRIEEIKEDIKKNEGIDEEQETVIKDIYKKIKIDAKDYYPKIEGRNLYNITSSSGLIRIILSYYTALLKTALKYKTDTHHPFLLILDEPRQQNLDIETFNAFLKELYSLQKNYPNQFQVILASSEKGSCKDKDIRLHLSEDNYLIKELDNS